VDEQEIELVRTSIRGVLADESGGALPDRLRALGWDELLAGDPAIAVGVLFEEQGRSLVTSRALDEVVAAALGIELGTGLALAHPALAQVDRAPGATGRVDGLVLAGLPPHAEIVVVTAEDPSPVWQTVGVDALDARPIEGFDPALGLVSVAGEIATGGTRAAGAWPDAVDAARRALAHELLGVAEATLALAVEHVTGREQFGHPIAAFQSVRHRLADDYVAITAARGAVDAAWLEPGPLACAAAKALAGRAALLATRDAQQVCGAIGFTWEHSLHHLLRRAWILDALYGTAAELERRIGEHLVVTGRVTRLLPLG
jgi:hypothetical protein